MSAGTFIGASESNPNFILHPTGYVPGNQNLDVNVCISPASDVTADLEVPVQNVVAVYNALQATTGNLQFGGNNNIPSGAFDAESVVLHEVGHCLGLAHVNLASESGLTGAQREYTKSTLGPDNSYDLNDGADNIIGSADDLRGDDTNLHYFKLLDNDPFTLSGTIDSNTYSRNLADLPSGSYAANGSRALAPALGVPNTEAVMQQGQFSDEAQRTLTADGVATLSYGASGVDEVAGTADDYALSLNYRGVTSSDCDITITVDNNTGFASCSVSFGFVSGNHWRITSATVRLNENTNWFYNPELADPINMAPTVDPISDVLTNENETVNIAISATDPDMDDSLTLSSPDAPGFCVLNDNGDGTGQLDCSPLPGDAGEYSITVTASDNGDPVQSANDVFTLTVLPEGVGLFDVCRTPIAVIPDNTGSPLSDVLSFTDARQIVDLDVTVTLTHPFVSDIVVSLTHEDTGTSVVLIDRAGIPATPSGCDGMDMDAVFDDEGADGPGENACAASSPSITGSLTPAEALANFNSDLLTGDWRLDVDDVESGDSGLLFQWCMSGSVMAVTDTDTDGDGVFDMTDNCTNTPNPDQFDTDGDGIGNRCDADFDNNCIVNFADISLFVPAFNSATGDPNYDPIFDIDSSGSISFIDFVTLTTSFLEAPGPSANECVVGN
ncbi:MAG: thrombospondin type 3 repeat-containing protein [Pseudomonadota bacterium]